MTKKPLVEWKCEKCGQIYLLPIEVGNGYCKNCKEYHILIRNYKEDRHIEGCPFGMQARTCPKCGKGLLMFEKGITTSLKCDQCSHIVLPTTEEAARLQKLLDFQKQCGM
jgi:hypothetical protein